MCPPDADVRLVPFSFDGAGIEGGDEGGDEGGGVGDGGARSTPGKGAVRVHRGFLKAYSSIRAPLRRDISLRAATAIAEGAGNSSARRALITGHSLGSAIAALFAYDLVLNPLPWKGKGKGKVVLNLSVATFGEPRVGNAAFAEDYNRLVPQSWRVVVHRDHVPSLYFAGGTPGLHMQEQGS